MNKLLTCSMEKLSSDWSKLNWAFRDFELEGTPDKNVAMARRSE